MQELKIEEMTSLRGGDSEKKEITATLNGQAVEIEHSFNHVLQNAFNTKKDSTGGIAAGGSVTIIIGVGNNA
jgi:hypothetical protein